MGHCPQHDGRVKSGHEQGGRHLGHGLQNVFAGHGGTFSNSPGIGACSADPNAKF